MSEAYDLYQLGRARLREGLAAQATVPLEKARRLEPDKASIREALGIAYFRITDWKSAEREFRKLLELSPVDDYAHYALGRSLMRQGRAREASTHLKARPLPEATAAGRITVDRPWSFVGQGASARARLQLSGRRRDLRAASRSGGSAGSPPA